MTKHVFQVVKVRRGDVKVASMQSNAQALYKTQEQGPKNHPATNNQAESAHDNIPRMHLSSAVLSTTNVDRRKRHLHYKPGHHSAVHCDVLIKKKSVLILVVF